jgi:hypothetical protein
MRKHIGINKNTGKLKKGYLYTQDKTKTGLSKIKKVKPKKTCKNYLKNKIKKNFKELKDKKYKNRQQALAVSYNMVKNEHPHCKKYLKKK